MQELWKHKLQWDETISPNISQEWTKLAEDMMLVKDIKIPRLLSRNKQFQLFGFSDASEKAYAAVIYCRSVLDDKQISVQLVVSKTRVAPLKNESLPRVKLSGALLLVKLMKFTCSALNIPISQSHFYTDSTIVLSWLGSPSSRWKTFVANRVAKIQSLSSPNQWHHISGDTNPADIATCGVSSSTLFTSQWFSSPTFLYQPISFLTNMLISQMCKPMPEERVCTVQSIAYYQPFI
ncbi:uncharacterized protein [Parasteatoda tepidariorum]|uniref:uncharacterized protein n=1 Tax=Parasteatoda tepidariorum TaxID=114398 RepID=UPI0039BCD6AC